MANINDAPVTGVATFNTLEDAIAEAHVALEQWQEANAFNRAVGDAGRRYRSAEQAYKESREMVL